LFFWTLQYTSIDHANNLIANIDEASGTKFQHLKGQAYALRAFNYFNLVRQYQFTYAKDKNAKAIPVYVKPTTPSTDPLPKVTVQQVYDRVIEDLTEAERLLPGFERTVKNRPDINVVYGLFARAYLTLEDWAKAAQYAAKAREGYPIMTAEQYKEGFNDVSNTEWIWGHPQTRTQNLGSPSYLSYISTTPYGVNAAGVNQYDGYNSIVPDPYFVASFEVGDVRGSLFEIEGDPTDTWHYKSYRYKKFINKQPDHDGHIVLMRASEMLLIEAEGKARQHDVDGALTALNELRLKRDLTALSGYTESQLIEAILLERRHELWGEGHRLYDILRLQIAPDRKETTETFQDKTDATVALLGHYALKFPDNVDFVRDVPNSKYFLFPIPLNEITNNPNLDK
jgi:hypothetical protein